MNLSKLLQQRNEIDTEKYITARDKLTNQFLLDVRSIKMMILKPWAQTFRCKINWDCAILW